MRSQDSAGVVCQRLERVWLPAFRRRKGHAGRSVSEVSGEA